MFQGLQVLGVQLGSASFLRPAAFLLPAVCWSALGLQGRLNSSRVGPSSWSADDATSLPIDDMTTDGVGYGSQWQETLDRVVPKCLVIR